MIRKKPPMLDEFSRETSCGVCPHCESCQSGRGLLQRRFDRRFQILYQNSWEDIRIWDAFDDHIQRAMIILSIIGRAGQRPGGYGRQDLKAIAGVSDRRALLRIREELESMGFLRRKTPADRWQFRLDPGRENLIYLQRYVNRARTTAQIRFVRKSVKAIGELAAKGEYEIRGGFMLFDMAKMNLERPRMLEPAKQPAPQIPPLLNLSEVRDRCVYPQCLEW